jgi:hypothetical protein
MLMLFFYNILLDMNDNIIIHLDSKDAYSNEDLTTVINYDGDYDHRLTYYFKNPIVLNSEYDLYVKSFVTNKRQTGSTIEYPDEVFSIATFNNYNTNTNQLSPVSYNQEVIDEVTSNVTVYLFSTQSQVFYPTDARITVKVVKNSGDANGLIEYISTESRGSGFDLNPCYILKADITAPTTLYNQDNGQTYAIFSPITLNGNTEIKTLSLQGGGNNTILSYATGVPITEGTFYNIPMYSPDGSGWYEYNGVRVTAKVVSTTGTNYGTVIIQEVTIGGSGFSLNDILYLDKFSVVDGVYPNTYSASARFGPFSVSSLVNGLGTLTPSSGISNVILPNSREYPFVDEVLNDIPFYKLDNGVYIPTDASGSVNVVKNAGNNQGSATLTTITDGGSGFAVPVTLYLNKADLTQNNNTYYANQYISFDAITLVDESADKDIEIKPSSNTGINFMPDGFYFWNDPVSTLKIRMEKFRINGITQPVRIVSVTGARYDLTAGDEIIMPDNEVYSEVFPGTTIYGVKDGNGTNPFIISVLSVSPIYYDNIMYKIGLENVKYNDMKYKNSDRYLNPTILMTDVKQNTIDLNTPVLTIIPQVICEIKLLVKQPFLINENIHVTLLLKKK